MKTLLLSALILTISSGAQARSILTFKTVNKCQTYTKGEPVTVDIQEAQDGQAQLVIAYPLKKEENTKVQVKKITPPKGLSGGSIKYVGKKGVTQENVTLTLTGAVTPIKIGKVFAKAATLSLEKQDEIKLACVAVK
ncbi:MAG: hypothetical protein K2Q18_02600 [Bdellovibrionales bacterium]|nr:hypothetical protein [Bdellovibrionales bacterium]